MTQRRDALTKCCGRGRSRFPNTAWLSQKALLRVCRANAGLTLSGSTHDCEGRRPLEEAVLEFPLTTRICLAEEIAQYGWTIGEYTYGAPMVFDHEFGHLSIGRFCSIAVGVSFLLGNHRTDLVTTYPFKVLADYWPGAEAGLEDHEDRGGIEIGSDVWIGAHATVVAGVKIASGAVVAAGAVVTKAVPPYAIVAGNPARVIRFRCTDTQIESLLEIAWWDWPEDRVRAEIGALTTLSIDEFIGRHRSA